MYMILRFAREKNNTSMQDPILERNVPNIVFLQNQRLLKEILKQKFKDEKMMKEVLVNRAQNNEHMF